MTKNLACRIFAEQINLIKQLPENERAIVLYEALTYAFNKEGYQNDNQIDNQNGNQVGYQNENAYISVSVSVYESLSDISKCVLDLLKKNIVCKEFSDNYGGKREGAGSKKDKPNNPSGKNQYTDKQKQDVAVEKKNDSISKSKLEDIINDIQSEKMRGIVKEWVEYKKERKESYTPTGLKKCITRLETLSGGNDDIAAQIVDSSIGNNYSGLFPPKTSQPKSEYLSKSAQIAEKTYQHLQSLFVGDENGQN